MSGTTSKSTTKPAAEAEPMELDDDDSDASSETLCVCQIPAEQAEDGKFWIGCEECEEWYHGHCLGLTSEEASLIAKWLCPTCERSEMEVYNGNGEGKLKVDMIIEVKWKLVNNEEVILNICI